MQENGKLREELIKSYNRLETAKQWQARHLGKERRQRIQKQNLNTRKFQNQRHFKVNPGLGMVGDTTSIRTET